ncbi:MAG: DNA repair protein RecN [Chitinophagales bacterium]
MLQKLLIKNYALIEEVELTFSDKLTIITGETGAGKSILLGALSLILGHRVNMAALSNSKKKCVVEGTFNISAYQLQPFFEKNELDYEDVTLIRREVTPSGKSRAFVNDTPVNLQILKQIGEKLVTLHAQHQTLHLFDAHYQLSIIDTLANHEALLTNYQKVFKSYQKNQNQIKKRKAESAQLQRDLDYIQFQLSELTEANLVDENEQESLEQELDQLNNSEHIQQSLAESINLLDEGELTILKQVGIVKGHLESISRFHPLFEELNHRLESVSIELTDIHNELTRMAEDDSMDPERLQLVSERLNLIFRLQKKHQVSEISELIKIREGLASQNQSADNLEDEIAHLEKTIAVQQKKLLALATKITKDRKKQIPVFERSINEMLTSVGMKDATVKAIHEVLPTHQLTAYGQDQIEILFSANRGSSHAELRKVASGGELSRLMLCIQSLIAANTALPTLIFDEIDTGISGEVALKVGKVLQDLANHHQLISITHLPQIASKGDAHLFVYKYNTPERTLSKIKKLSGGERVTEIAKMLSGDDPGKMALANAKELLTYL